MHRADKRGPARQSALAWWQRKGACGGHPASRPIFLPVPHENPCRAFRRLRREPRFAMRLCQVCRVPDDRANGLARSEEHTSELQSLMRISYAVFCLKKKTTETHVNHI